MSRRFLMFAVSASLIAGTLIAPIIVDASSIVIVNHPEAQHVPQFFPSALRADQLLLGGQGDERTPLAADIPACNLKEKIVEARALLEPVPLKIGTVNHRYTERRAGSTVTFRDPEKTIALALMDATNCEVRTTTISKRGDSLISGADYVIEAVRRSNGIQWNNWATEFHILRPDNQVVILLKYPYAHEKQVARTVAVSGKRRVVYDTTSVIVPVYYTPYSKELHVPELVQGGEDYLSELAGRVYADVREREVQSLAVPGWDIADVAAFHPEYITRLAPIEHMDLTEFLLDPTWTTERIHIVIGANLDHVATYTCSKASACGLMQFTRGTYAFMRKLYPTAGLIADFEEGARDQYNALKAALLLHDYNAAQLVSSFGVDILEDPQLEEYLAAAYNTGVGRVISVVAIAKKKKSLDWAEASGTIKGSKLLPETKGYIAKLRFLRDWASWRTKPLAQIDTIIPNH